MRPRCLEHFANPFTLTQLSLRTQYLRPTQRQLRVCRTSRTQLVHTLTFSNLTLMPPRLVHEKN